MAERAPKPVQAVQPVMIHPEQIQQLQQSIHGSGEDPVTRKTREELKSLIRQTTDCDGSSYRPLKQWFEDIDISSNYSQSNSFILEVATKTSKGELRREIENYLNIYAEENEVDRFSTPWTNLRSLYATFIPLTEADDLKDSLHKLKQSPGEVIAAYNRRFKLTADDAYPRNFRNEDQQRILLKCYISSLTSLEIRRPLVHSAPKTIDQAMFKALEIESFEKRLTSMGPHLEEPMDISAIRHDQYQPDITTVIYKAIDERFATLSIGAVGRDFYSNHYDKRPYKQTGNNIRYTNPLAWTEDGRPICYECGRPNHIARQCLARKTHHTQFRVPQNTQNPRVTYRHDRTKSNRHTTRSGSYNSESAQINTNRHHLN